MVDKCLRLPEIDLGLYSVEKEKDGGRWGWVDVIMRGTVRDATTQRAKRDGEDKLEGWRHSGRR